MNYNTGQANSNAMEASTFIPLSSYSPGPTPSISCPVPLQPSRKGHRKGSTSAQATGETGCWYLPRTFSSCMRTESSVSEEPGTHSIHCDPPLALPAPSPAQTHSSEHIVFAHCTLAFSSFALLRDFRDTSKDIKLQWVYFTENKIEAHWDQGLILLLQYKGKPNLPAWCSKCTASLQFFPLCFQSQKMTWCREMQTVQSKSTLHSQGEPKPKDTHRVGW